MGLFHNRHFALSLKENTCVTNNTDNGFVLFINLSKPWQSPETEASKWKPADVDVIIYAWASSCCDVSDCPLWKRPQFAPTATLHAQQSKLNLVYRSCDTYCFFYQLVRLLSPQVGLYQTCRETKTGWDGAAANFSSPTHCCKYIEKVDSFRLIYLKETYYARAQSLRRTRTRQRIHMRKYIQSKVRHKL